MAFSVNYTIQFYQCGQSKLIFVFAFASIQGRKSVKGWFMYENQKKGKEREVNPKAIEILNRHHVAPKIS